MNTYAQKVETVVVDWRVFRGEVEVLICDASLGDGFETISNVGTDQHAVYNVQWSLNFLTRWRPVSVWKDVLELPFLPMQPFSQSATVLTCQAWDSVHIPPQEWHDLRD